MKLNSSSISNNPAVTTLSHVDDYSVRKNFPKTVVWSVILIFVMGLLAGGFILGAVHNAILLVVVAVLFVIVAALVVWNMCRGSRSIIEFIGRYPDTDLRTAKNGQYVKVSGVCTGCFHCSFFYVDVCLISLCYFCIHCRLRSTFLPVPTDCPESSFSLLYS
jgi:uncharacterized membrane protein YfcA